MIIPRQKSFSDNPEQKEYSLRSFVKILGLPEDYINRKIRQLSDSKLISRFRSIFPKSYNYLRSIKSKIKI
jgi:hypothetical protein